MPTPCWRRFRSAGDWPSTGRGDGSGSSAGRCEKSPFDEGWEALEDCERLFRDASELALLELEWKEAEEVAAIADKLAIPEEVEQHLARLRGEVAK